MNYNCERCGKSVAENDNECLYKIEFQELTIIAITHSATRWICQKCYEYLLKASLSKTEKENLNKHDKSLYSFLERLSLVIR
jgi:hypothetical protein